MKLVLVLAVLTVAAGCSAPRLVYVTSSDGYLTVIDAKSLETVKTLEVAGGPWGIEASAARPRVYVANFRGKTVVGIDTRASAIEETIHCYYPWGVAVKPRTK